MTPAMQAAVDLVLTTGRSLNVASYTTGVSPSSLRVALIRSGHPPAPTIVSPTKGMIYGVKRAVDLVVNEGYTASAAARACKVDLNNLFNALRRLGHPPLPNYGRLKLF